MTVFPQTFDKAGFIKYLRKNKVNNVTVKRVMNLPESVIHGDVTYYLYITTRWYSIGKTHYEFELNYYSEEMVQFLLNIEPYNDIETSLNHIECELINLNLLDDICDN